MNHLDELEAQSIYILREAFARLKKLALLWSLGKDSNVMIWLARKAFFAAGRSRPCMSITGKKFAEMYAFRDRFGKEWELDLKVEPCRRSTASDPTLPPAARSAARRRRAEAGADQIWFRRLDRRHSPRRRGNARKERCFSPRGSKAAGTYASAPEFWTSPTLRRRPAASAQSPILHWTEGDIWAYNKRENIPIIPLYLARDGKRYRSLGDQDITIRWRAARQYRRDPDRTRRHQGRTRRRALDHETEMPSSGCVSPLSLTAIKLGKLGAAMNMILPSRVSATPNAHPPAVRIVIVGHVDHGKSTLVGRCCTKPAACPRAN